MWLWSHFIHLIPIKHLAGVYEHTTENADVTFPKLKLIMKYIFTWPFRRPSTLPDMSLSIWIFILYNTNAYFLKWLFPRLPAHPFSCIWGSLAPRGCMLPHASDARTLVIYREQESQAPWRRRGKPQCSEIPLPQTPPIRDSLGLMSSSFKCKYPLGAFAY